jgi:hypothetical protein
MSRKLLLVVGDEKKELFIEGYSVSDGIYEGHDLIIEIFPQIQEVIAEGVEKPSVNGIFNEEGTFSDVILADTSFNASLDVYRTNYLLKFIDKTEGYPLVDRYKLTTQVYSLDDIEKAIKELSDIEKKLSNNHYLKIIKPPEIRFLKNRGNTFTINEDIELYESKTSRTI